MFGDADYFDRLARDLGDDWDWRALQRVRLEWCLRVLDRRGRRTYRRALDLGCGYGHFTGLLTGRCGAVLGVDGAAEPVARASARYPRAEFRAGRLEDLRLPEGRFDLVAAVEVLYYLDPEARAALLARVGGWLAPGGHLLISARMKDTPYFRAAEADSLLPAGFALVGADDLRLGWLHTLEGLAARAVRGRRVGWRRWVAGPAEALCRRPGWLRAGAAALGRLPGVSPTYRAWLLRKPER